MRSLEKSTKWTIRDGLNGIAVNGLGAPIANGFPKSRGFRTACISWVAWLEDGGESPIVQSILRVFETFRRFSH
jgi:hypothetical protein